MWETIFFWILAGGALLSSLAAVLIPRNPLYNALALIIAFFFFAGLYALLSAHFLAVVQVLVYGGAIMVLFMFIIMLLNIRESEKTPIRVNFHQILGVLTACAFLGVLVGAFQPLFNEEAVELGHDAYVHAQQEAKTEEAFDAVQLRTPTPVPGLDVALNEAAINARYEANMLAYARHDRRPADGPFDPNDDRIFPKYREFDRTTEVVIPQELLPPQDPDIAPREPSSFGTVEPLSVMLVNRFVVPFELTAILLLAAVVGAFIIAKKRL